MKLYHGSNVKIAIPDLSKSKPFKDFGQGFYLSADRNRLHPIHHYDIVYGPIADDGVTFQLRRFQAGAISIEELVKELQYTKGITFQYFFGTSLALSKLIKL